MIFFLIAISIIIGAVLQINLIGSRAFLVSKLDPIIAVYTGIFAGIFITIFFRFLTTPKFKFAKFASLLMIIQTFIYGSFYIINIPDEILAILWITFAAFSIGISKWVTSEMANKYLDPARTQSFFSYLSSFLGIGFIVSFIFLKFFEISLTPKETLLLTSILFLIIGLLIAIGFIPKHVLEINLEKKSSTDQYQFDSQNLVKLKKWFGLLCFLIGGTNIIFSYLINIQIKKHLTSFESMNQLINNYTLTSSILVLIAGVGLGQIIKKKRTSPITILIFSHLVLLMISTIALIFGNFELFILLEISQKFISQSLLVPSMQQIINAFIKIHKKIFISLQQFFYFTFTTPVLAAFFYFSSKLNFYSETDILSISIIIFLCISIITIKKFENFYKSLLVEYIQSNIFGAKVLASQMLSFLRPNNFVELMKDELKKNQQYYLRKTIILGLGYSTDSSTTEIIKNEFRNEKEEVQIAVLEALSTQERFEGVSFIMDILSMKVLPKSFSVRLNATKLIAKLYNTKAIPIILEGLNDADHRVIANVLETLSNFRNKDLIKYFIKFSQHENQRVKANALMGCFHYKETKTIYMEAIKEAIETRDVYFLPSAFYIIGALADNTFNEKLNLIASDPQLPSNFIAPLSYALICNKENSGFQLALSCFNQEFKQNNEISFTHFLTQLSKIQRFDFVRHSTKDKTTALNVLVHLKNSRFDFHEEVEYLKLLIED